jgi:outer membrane protein TolC
MTQRRGFWRSARIWGRSGWRVLVATSVIAALGGRVSAAAQSSIAAPLLSLDSAVALARERNRPLQIVRAEVERARQQLTGYRTRKLPLFDVKIAAGSLVAPLDFRFAAGVFGVSPALGSIPKDDTTITTGPRASAIVFGSVIQPLTQLARIGSAERAARVGIDIAAEEARAREIELVASVKQLYYGIVQAEASIRSRVESVRQSRELVRVMDQYAAERVVLETEALTARAGLSEQEYQLTLARNLADGYRERMNALLARDLVESFAVEPMRPAAPLQEHLKEAEARAVAERPEVRLRQLQSRRAAAALAATKRPGVPDLSLSFNYVGLYNFELLPTHGALIGVTATWEPWDWGRTAAERQEHLLLQKQADVAVAEAETQVRVQVRAAFRALHEAFALVEVSETARTAARERLRVVTDRFTRELALEREVLDAQARLAAADHASTQALAGYWTARAEYERGREP